ncbi:MAG: hypothetical protein Tp138OMZ00d2C19078221_22 [Prokaryotic dsDNA virus sp.]|jgi:hypothetical protein|nr:hypothetical protein [Pseudomonadales bacterium]QDP67450.1 MAG: hypothetical protein Tp138OMZ00d2C19078221_22 [Prokaryotic dsDNA virus sp.]|tara:strand:+ start:269 stop:481 length:213 start_codon:yes stop_codon:yes gene_type:complete
MTTLPFDIARCAGRFDLMPDGQWCPERDTCQRYLAFVQWDRGVVADYRSIRVNMAAPDCKHKIEVTNEPI